MKILKILVIIVVIIVAIPLLVGLFGKKDYSVVEEISINKPLSEVFEYVKYLKNQDNFSKWASMDPDMTKEFRGTDGEVGFVSGWRSEDPSVGSGEQEILAMEEGKRIDYAMRFFEPFEGSDKAYFEFESLNDNQTLVRWGFEGHMDFPMNSMIVFMGMEKMIGDDFKIGLKNLKEIVEN